MSRASLPVVLAILVALAGRGAARADLFCPAPTVDVGEVRSGAPLAQPFVLVNRGAEAVEVVGVRPSCGCIRPEVRPLLYPPGQEGALLLEVNTLTQPAGPHAWTLQVVYRCGGKEESLTLTVTARVVTEITVEPPVLALSTDTAIAHEITVTDRRERPLDLLSVQASLPQVRASLGEPRRDDQGRWCRPVRVEVLPDCPEGRHEAVLLLLTNDPAYPALRVPLTVTKRPRAGVRATPEAISLTAAGDGPLPARVVLLASADDRPVLVERVEADDPAVECRWAPGPGPRATLKVQVDRARVPGAVLQTTVRVHLSGPTPQALTLPVTCTLK
jgi:Protein of unknown function (DUF1573)